MTSIFLSYRELDTSARDLLVATLRNAESPLNIAEFPVETKWNASWKNAVRNRMKKTTGTLVIVTEHTAASEAIRWEIAETVRLSNKLVGVRHPGSESSQLPLGLTEADIVRWDAQCISRRFV